ncbi:GNAT family N-acetyltransferase [Phaeobacter marinintestinus]|uniref:GNAT family N-acetyltransferase n=1 Tax=Falsiphaeobacter marinintestinus TaxID=1492905 RepID=UPI00319E9C6B
MANVRPARSTDAGSLGDILYDFQRDTEWMPDLYTGAETIAFCGTMIERGWVTVAEVDDQIAGFLARDGEEIVALYLSPDIGRRGVGRQLLNAAKQAVKRLELHTFEANEGAQRFYLRQGFVEKARGDGSDNEENLPDITYVWTQEEAEK